MWLFMSLIFVLEGQHVQLRPLQPPDAHALLQEAIKDRSTYQYATVPQTAESMMSYVSSACHDRDKKLAVPFVIIHIKNQQVLGSSRFANLEYWKWSKENLHYPDTVEIGWTWLTPSVQRTAVNTETKYLMLSYAFEVWKVQRVTFKTDARNLRSRKAIERIGATYEGTLRSHMLAVDGTIRDSAYYAIIQSDWPQISFQLKSRLVQI
jgi:RimJ/RimL family protein N-acetyltransferase